MPVLRSIELKGKAMRVRMTLLKHIVSLSGIHVSDIVEVGCVFYLGFLYFILELRALFGEFSLCSFPFIALLYSASDK